MPRYMNKERDGRLYRVVVTTTWASGDGITESTQVYGSYNALASAKTQLKRHVTSDDWYTYRDRARQTVGHIEYTDATWHKLEDN
jgi:hypothetical protein